MSTVQILVTLILVIDVVALVVLVARFRRNEREMRSVTSATSPQVDHDQVIERAQAWRDVPDPVPHWKERAATAGTDGATQVQVDDYRVRRDSDVQSPRWNPYAEGQSRRARVRLTREEAKARKRVEYNASDARLEAPAPNHYQTLGVLPTATLEQIEQAYRRYVAEIHPDKFFDDATKRREAETRLRELNAIMQVLRDPARRAEYDLDF